MFKKIFLNIIVGVLFLLCIPVIAMQFSNQVNWSFFDFIVAGILLLVTAFLIDQIVQKTKTYQLKIILITITIVFLVFIWLELAVGIFGTPFAGS